VYRSLAASGHTRALCSQIRQTVARRGDQLDGFRLQNDIIHSAPEHKYVSIYSEVYLRQQVKDFERKKPTFSSYLNRQLHLF
jgi:hypothetical protein